VNIEQGILNDEAGCCIVSIVKICCSVFNIKMLYYPDKIPVPIMTAEKEILLNEAYHAFYKAGFIDNHMSLDILEKIVSADFMGYGTAKDEKVNSIDQLKQMIIRQREQSVDLEMQLGIVPVFRRYAADENAAVYVDEITLALKKADTSFQLALRFTTVFAYENKQWKVIHMHGSVPGRNEGETDTWGIDEWKTKNKELEKMVAEKTADLEIKNRELEIEGSLERVRACSMAMVKSEDLLSVITVVGKELERLGIQFDSTNFRINVGEKDWDLWIYAKWMDTPQQWYVPYIGHPYFATKEIEGKVSSMVFSKEDRNSFNSYLTKLGLIEIPDDSKMAESQKEYFHSGKGFAWSIATGKKVSLNIANSQAKPYTEEENALLMRFTIAFEQAYTRFLDLQKAEAQSREAQIELGLERVRARAMSMQNSEELKDLIGTVFIELTKLNVVLARCLIMIYDPGTRGSMWWMANSEAQQEPIGLFVQYHEHPPYLAYVKAWQDRVIRWRYELHGQQKKDWDDYLFIETELSKLPDFVIAGMKAPESVWLSASFNNFGNLTLATLDPLPEEHFDIMLRFAKVFDLTYTRFNDLKKAEAQVKEARIEAGLERVRYSAMAMQSSEDVGSASAIVFNEISLLGVEAMRCGITIIHPDMTADVWAATATKDGKEMKGMGYINFDEHPLWVGLFDAWKNKEESFSYDLKGEDLQSYYTILTHSPNYNSSYIQSQEFPDHTFYASFFEQGAVFTFSLLPHSDEKRKILKRFTAVFSLTFRRYLDLKQAEAQAREAQIEAALERVRSRTMAMHKSNDLLNVISVLSEQFQLLGFKVDSANFNTSYREKDWNLWLYNPGIPLYPDQIRIPYFDHPYFNRTIEGLAQGKDFNSFVFSKEEKDSFLDHLYSNTIARDHVSEERKKYVYSKPGFAWSVGYLANTAITIANYDAEPYTEEQNTILRRFGNVFEQSYTRFLDLQKAETQTKEAEIQLALERIRARTMAMQRSEELAETCELLFEEFSKLRIVKAGKEGTAGDRATIGIFNETEGTYDLSITNLVGKKLDHTFRLSIKEPVNIAKVYVAWKAGKSVLEIDMHGDDLNRWFNYIETLGLPVNRELYNKRRVNTFAFFSQGTLGISTNEPLPEESLQLLKRFTDTFNLTYTRFQDLKDAEARTKIAVREASLDRVRAEIASMRTAEDLQHITPLVWRELTALGVPFFRCGVFIVDDENQKIHFYLSAPDGKPLAALELGFDGADVTKNATAHWREQKIYVTHWSKEAFQQFAQNLVSQGHVQNIHTYQDGEEAPESLSLQFIPFAQGMMYVGSAEDLHATQIEMVQSLADAFSTAYARYEDFNKLEAAKQQIESTLKDLRATQTQLIQSEKMASLGELTAGIAHEIQNPLNFVNNFSEVSTELVDEMNEEIQKGNLEDAKQIASDLKDNLTKINHHGKRAGDIVKGMLQHSRSSSGEKELTDINALTDEYLRLAYHGLRAKDKSFNATMTTDFDASIGKINVVAQDIGRVILNLITNAFYAVGEKKKQTDAGYEPTVTISTKKSNGKIEIGVRDNGSGIPQKVLDKIFQPFFTTKPTGQGTGLGLSLSYDIVKAHGGELSVDTIPDAGTTFIIHLPHTTL
jgi:signal transduction histidine kinase